MLSLLLLVTTGVVIVVVAVVVHSFGGNDVYTIIVDIKFLFFCFVVFNSIIVSGEENLFTLFTSVMYLFQAI